MKGLLFTSYMKKRTTVLSLCFVLISILSISSGSAICSDAHTFDPKGISCVAGIWTEDFGGECICSSNSHPAQTYSSINRNPWYSFYDSCYILFNSTNDLGNVLKYGPLRCDYCGLKNNEFDGYGLCAFVDSSFSTTPAGVSCFEVVSKSKTMLDGYYPYVKGCPAENEGGWCYRVVAGSRLSGICQNGECSAVATHVCLRKNSVSSCKNIINESQCKESYQYMDGGSINEECLYTPENCISKCTWVDGKCQSDQIGCIPPIVDECMNPLIREEIKLRVNSISIYRDGNLVPSVEEVNFLDNLEIKMQVENYGNVDVQNLQVKLSVNGQESEQYVDLSTGSVQDIIFNYQVPEEQGLNNLEISAVADSGNFFIEATKEDNVRAHNQPVMTDLSITEIRVYYLEPSGNKVEVDKSKPLVVGRNYIFAATILKIGVNNIADKIYGVVFNIKNKEEAKSTQKIGSSGGVIIEKTIKILPEQVEEGKINIHSEVDSNNEISESKEDNNYQEITFDALTKHPPILLKPEITPDYFKKYNAGDWVKYSQIFTDNLKCRVTISDIDYAAYIKTSFTIIINSTGKNFDRKKSISGDVSCGNGKECIFDILIADIFPGDTLTCVVNATDEIKNSAVAESDAVKMPTFDLKVDKVDVLNVVSGADLIAKKAIAGRVWVKIDSNLIDELDKELPVSLTQLPIGKVTEKKYTSSIKSLKKYPALQEMKDKAIADATEGDTSVGIEKNGPSALLLLWDIKQAKESANFVNMAQLPIQGDYYFYGSVDFNNGNNGVIKESDETNNNIVKPNIKPVINLKKKATFQRKRFNLAVALITNGDKSLNSEEELTKKMAENIEFLKAASPLVNLRVEYWIMPKVYYNETILNGFSEDASDQAKAAAYTEATKAMKAINADLSNLKRRHNSDFIAGIAVNNNLLIRCNPYPSKYCYLVAGESSRYSRTATIFPRSSTVLFHEMGHGLIGLDEEYYPTPGVIGKANQEYGFDSRTKELKVNIWTEVPLGAYGHAYGLDVPENVDISYRYDLSVGKRYINLMGAALDSMIWINKESYNKSLGPFYMK